MAKRHITLSIESDLYEQLKAAGLSPSVLLTEAATLALGGRGKPKPPGERMDALERTVTQLARRVGKLEGK